MIYHIEHTDTIISPVYQDALALRKTIFVEEQNVPLSLEIDPYEKHCRHFVLYHDERPLATCRSLPLENAQLKLQRMAVKKEYRGQHIGSYLLNHVIEDAQNEGYQSIILGAQEHAVPFYQALGFNICSERYMDADIPHFDMKKEI
ncbi:GNAT family N-acetyltransferase [Vagococcus lutrae]|uniref:GNAT family N-acetyltransferase n=1 Tax=Vagococcus lutrae TaxID=81947 RepID=UPI001443C81A|nr:GNAT family N-acetyltransferase [Vagococcus lutrae]NKZ27786.1 GNAT family N-acetyltransferase [Vagococcus lutrae]